MSESRESRVAEFQRLLREHEFISEQLAAMAQRLAVHRLADVLPGATTLEVTGEFNEDWQRVLRIDRVVDDEGELLIDVHSGSLDERIEAVIDEVNSEYLDLLMDLTGDAYLGRHEISRAAGG